MAIATSTTPSYPLDVVGTGRFTGTVTAPTFSGVLSGNASTATSLQTARTINGVSFNGSANITIYDATKLPLSGGTLSGALTMGNNKITNLATPTAATDAATMGYVDSKGGGSWSCREVKGSCSTSGCYAQCDCAADELIFNYCFGDNTAYCDSWTDSCYVGYVTPTSGFCPQLYNGMWIDSNSIKVQEYNTQNMACCRALCCSII